MPTAPGGGAREGVKSMRNKPTRRTCRARSVTKAVINFLTDFRKRILTQKKKKLLKSDWTMTYKRRSL